MKKALTSFLLFISSNIFGQTTIFNPDKILVGNRKLPTVLLVGTFHFGYPNLDVHKTDADKQVDVLTSKKQIEVEQLVNYIAKFKPNKIVIETRPGELRLVKLLNKHKSINKGLQKAGRDEFEQIAFRLMNRFKLDTLFGADANSIFNELYNSKDSTILRPTLDKIFTGWQNYNYECNDPICVLQDSVSKIETEMEFKLPLLDVFKYINSEQSLKRNYGGYLNGEYFTQGQYRGADALAMDWYDRNLRIFRNIQTITSSADDRILVMFGSGHISILRQIFECDPNYKTIKFNELK